MGISSSELAALRRVVNQYLPDRGVNSRTDETLDLRIGDDRRDVHLEGLPQWMPIRRWKLTSRDGANVLAGDSIAVSGKGTYFVLEVASPTSYSVSTTAFCILMLLSDGVTVPIASNATVTFRRLQADGSYASSAAVGVAIAPVSPDEYELGDFSRIEWQVVFPTSTTIAGLPVGPDDQIVWGGLRIPEGFATLKRPIARPGPLPYSTARFSEPA